MLKIFIKATKFGDPINTLVFPYGCAINFYTYLEIMFFFLLGIESLDYLPHSFQLHCFVRSQSCVDYAEKAALHKHSMWSSVAVDILLGYLFGIALFFHSESACIWVSNSANNITNHLLRNGCVWLMGVPAGFKLNTELAGVLGMISLNAIQIWSTLWFFWGSLFIYFVQGLAIVGVLFGLTAPAALVIDMMSLSALHVSTVHGLISYIYSHQIQAIAALWRLFRYCYADSH